jgi:hypothetical protein
MMAYKIPTDEKLLAAVGRIAVTHGHLDHAVRMLIKSICAISPEEAMDATKRTGSAELRIRVKKLAKQKLGDGPALVRLEALLHRAKEASDLRNEYLHPLWAGDPDGEAKFLRADRTWQDPPPVEKVAELADGMLALANEINRVRLHSFLAEALQVAAARQPKADETAESPPSHKKPRRRGRG